MDSFIQDVRLGLRQMMRRPAATIIVVLTLGLGVGANTSMLALLNATLFKAPSVPEAGRLTWIVSSRTRQPRPASMSYPDFRDVSAQARSYGGVAGWSNGWVALGGETPIRVPALVVSGNYFDVLGVSPKVGRFFRPDEDSVPLAKPAAVISHALWKSRYASDPRVTDSLLTVNGHLVPIVGVAREDFAGVEMHDQDVPLGVWMTFAMIQQVMPGEARFLERRRATWLRVVGRLAPGASLDAASSELALIAARTRDPAESPDDARLLSALPVSGGLDPNNRAEIASMAPLLLVVPMLLLAVAWANAANVLLARSMERRKEIALRLALGASRSRVVRQLLTEGALVALCAAFSGVMLSYWLTALITSFGGIPDSIAAIIVPDETVIVATTLLALITGLFFSLAPALAATKLSLTPAIKEDGATVTVGRQRHRLRDLFLVGQVAISLTLLITGGLFVQSVAKMLRVDPGYDPRNTFTATVDLQMQGYSPEAKATFERTLLGELTVLPGVESAALASTVPFLGRFNGSDVLGEGGNDTQWRSAFLVSATPGIVEAQGLRLARGRAFTDADARGTAPVAIVTSTLATRLWGTSEAVGKRFHLGDRNSPMREVVGVVADVQYDDLASEPRGVVFLPVAQEAMGQVTLVVRTRGDAAQLAAPVIRLIRAIDPNLPVYRVTTLAGLLAENGADKRQAAASMVGVFGVLALLLASLGIYGVTAHGVTLRNREIGIRMSLGAKQADVIGLFVREGFGRVTVGIGVGVVLSIAVSTILSSFLFGLRATDLFTFVSAALVLAAVAAFASWVPARRAARVDPMTSLRAE